MSKKTHPADEFITSRPVFHSAVDKGYRLDIDWPEHGVRYHNVFGSRGAARAQYTKICANVERGKRLAVANGIAVHGSVGCPRCRLDKIMFLVEVKLPRFVVKPGERWNIPQAHFDAQGSAALGNGLAHPSTFIVEARDYERASHNGLPCPGNPAMEQIGGGS